jgi:hypothetical protein
MYYIHADAATPRNTLILDGCRISPLENGEHTRRIDGEVTDFFPFVISHPNSSKAYFLASTSRAETDDWIRVLRLAASPLRRASLRRKTSIDNSRVWRRSDSIGSASEMGGEKARTSGDASLSHLVPPELASKVGKAIKALLENTGATDNWEPAFTRNEVHAFRRPGALMSVRGEGVIEHHPVSVLLAIMDLERRKAYDSQFEFGRRVKLFNTHTFMDYLRYRAVWPTSARDMYNLVHWQVQDQGGAIVVVAFSDRDQYPEEEGCVRAECIIAGWLIRPAAGKQGELVSQVSFLLQTDLKGTIPYSIKNMVAESQPMLIASLRKFLSDNQDKDDYKCALAAYTNHDVEPLMDNLNRRVLASESAVGHSQKRKPLHQRSLSIKEIQSGLPPHIDARVEDAVNALLENECKMEGWDLFMERDGDKGYIKEGDAADVNILWVRAEGVIQHPAVAVMHAVTTLDCVNIYNSAIEFKTHDMLYNVHTWVTYLRLKAIYPMPTRDVCQLVHWRVVDDDKIVVVAVDDDTHKEEEGYVRAHMYEGWILRPTEDGKGCRVVSIWSVDIKGVMTQAVRSDLSEKQALVISSVRRFLDEYAKTSPDIAHAEGVEISNVALQPLVVQWNRWPPNMVPDRVKAERQRRRSSLASIPSSGSTGSDLGGLGERKGSEPEITIEDLTMPNLGRSASAPVTSSLAGRPPRKGVKFDEVGLALVQGGGAALTSPTGPGPAPESTGLERDDGMHGDRHAAGLYAAGSVAASASVGAAGGAATGGVGVGVAAGPLASVLGLGKLLSSEIDNGSPLVAAKSVLPFLMLFVPVLLYFFADRAYRGITFALSAAAALRFVVHAQPSRPYSSSLRGSEWGQESMKSKVQVKFPVEVKKLMRYLDSKRKESSDITVTHVAMRAVGIALRENPDVSHMSQSPRPRAKRDLILGCQLNGHTVLGRFFPSKAADVSCELRMKDKDHTYAMLKVFDADKKSTIEIATNLVQKQAALAAGMDSFAERRKLMLKRCPPYLAHMLDRLFTYLGAGLGLSVPALGIRAFPQGNCVVITSPTPASKSASESDFIVEPMEDSTEYLSPMVLTIGGIYMKPKAENNNNQLVMVPVLNVSMMIRLHNASLQQVRRFTDVVQKYMGDPRLLDTYTPRAPRA